MVQLAFGARVLYGAGERKPAGLVPERVASPLASVVVRNPFTGRPLVVRSQDVVNIVNGVATIRMETAFSGRWFRQARRDMHELINPATGNTFQVSTRAIIKETT